MRLYKLLKGTPTIKAGTIFEEIVSMSDEDKRDFFGDNAEVVVDGYEIEDYDWSDTSEIEEELV